MTSQTNNAGPTFTTAELSERSIYRRAVEAAIWGIAAVNYRLMYQEMVDKAKGGFNQIVYWSRLLDWKNQTLTPNPDVIYLMPFFNTRDVGPVVLEDSARGRWRLQRQRHELLAGRDRGRRAGRRGQGQGRQVCLPAARLQGPLPDGYIPMPSNTYQGYALLRSVLKSGGDEAVAKAVAYARRIKLYPLSQVRRAAGDGIRRCERRRVRLDDPLRLKLLRDARHDDADRAVAGTRQGDHSTCSRPSASSAASASSRPRTRRRFSPTPTGGAGLVRARYDDITPFYEGGRWFFPSTEEMVQNVMKDWHVPNSYPIDARGTAYSLAFFSAKHLGESQYDLLAGRDKNGNELQAAPAIA